MKIDVPFVDQVIKVAEPTADFIVNERKGFQKSSVEIKGKNDLVSYVDKEAEKQLVEGLSKLIPEAGIIGEEYEYESKSGGLNWIIDPLDGTTNYIHGVPVYSISIGLIDKNEMQLGVVYDLERKEIYKAINGQGAFMNNERINVSAENTLEQSLIATGFPYSKFNEIDNYLKTLKTLMEACHGIRRMGSAALDLANVACGRFEGFFEFNLNAWDVAAGALIVKEAGGVVSDFRGGENYIFGREIVAGCFVHRELQQIIDNHWA